MTLLVQRQDGYPAW